ncbi:MAG: STAS domain-containing protein [Anaerosomatales bacterium]|nr:STAS domain-containing protein [Anaerosomatales bacterium]
MSLSIHIDPLEDHWVLKLDGDLDYSECARFRMTVDRVLRDAPPSTIIDLTGVDYLDSSGLGLLLSLSKEYGATGGRLVLVTNEVVDNILELTRLSSIFSTAPGVEEARQMLADTARL